MKTKEQDYTIAYALSCPLLLNEKQRNNPYDYLEQFFGHTSLGGHRKELTRWFKCASHEGVKYKRASNLLFTHSQFVQLINAAFLIVSLGHKYEPKPYHNEEPLGQWLVRCGIEKEKSSVEHYSYTLPYWLKIKYREDPFEYLKKTLTIKRVTVIREGLQEWLDAASSKYMSLEGFGHEYSFELYELLQKIIEACYLILVAGVSVKQEVS